MRGSLSLMALLLSAAGFLPAQNLVDVPLDGLQLRVPLLLFVVGVIQAGFLGNMRGSLSLMALLLSAVRLAPAQNLVDKLRRVVVPGNTDCLSPGADRFQHEIDDFI